MARQKEIDNFEKTSLSQAPITITQQAMQMNEEMAEEVSNKSKKLDLSFGKEGNQK